jgi:hypothetical protein
MSTAAIMRTLRHIYIVNRMRAFVAGAFVILMCSMSMLQAQDAKYPAQKATPPRIEPQIVVLAESVVHEQWTHTLALVNAPRNISFLNPGQCIRVGIVSTGDKRDEYLKNTRASFHVEFAGHSDFHPLTSLAQFKQIKPEGADFAIAALGAAGVNSSSIPMTIASLGASGEHWCVPNDAADGVAIVGVEVESPGGHQVLNSSNIQIESFAAGSKKSFKNIEELGAFSETYYRQPNPARLLPALQFMVADQTQHAGQGQAEIFAAFFSAALNSDPIAAREFQKLIVTQPPLTRAFGLLILRSAGFDIDSVLNSMDAQVRQTFLSLPPLQDPFDLTPKEELFQHLDMLWAVFGATGQFKPVKTVASALSWRADYEDFDKLRKSPNHPSTLTPSIVRGIVYTAAGWSLSSFQRNDPLVADYIGYLHASSETPQSVKSELKDLSSNLAFKRPGGQ